jgi:hypothetical protein
MTQLPVEYTPARPGRVLVHMNCRPRDACPPACLPACPHKDLETQTGRSIQARRWLAHYRRKKPEVMCPVVSSLWHTRLPGLSTHCSITSLMKFTLERDHRFIQPGTGPQWHDAHASSMSGRSGRNAWRRVLASSLACHSPNSKTGCVYQARHVWDLD